MSYISYNVSKDSKMKFEVEFYETESGKVPIVKKTQKIPAKELSLAKKYRDDYLKRQG